ncbi:MAG TPA: NlpC/P60 family protein, partial [Kribbellaceae bacterium]
MSALNLGRRRTRSPRRVTARMVTVSLGFLLAIGSAGLTAVPAHADGCGVLVSGASPAAERAVAAACRMVGKPYAWGGGHEGLPAPSQGHIDVGDPINSGHDGSYWSFDCAGLMRWAWFEATGRDLLGPGTVDSQHTVASGLSGSRVFTKADGLSPLLPGDLLYFRDFKGLHHTSMYLGAGKVVQARQSGEPIGVGTPNMDEYDGAIRLSADQPSPPFRYGNEGKSEITWGRPNYRTGRNTSSEIKYTGAGGSANVRVLCQANGEEVTVDGMTNYVWSYLPEYELWVSNI